MSELHGLFFRVLALACELSLNQTQEDQISEPSTGKICRTEIEVLHIVGIIVSIMKRFDWREKKMLPKKRKIILT